MVQNAERLIGRLEGELSEDSQAARHLQSCLAQAVTRAKAVGGVSKGQYQKTKLCIVSV